MPNNIDYFLDPAYIIKHYKSCELNESKSGVVGYGLAEVWCFIKEKTQLDGAHDALEDTLAQCEVVHDERFLKFIDKPVSIESMHVTKTTRMLGEGTV